MDKDKDVTLVLLSHKVPYGFVYKVCVATYGQDASDRRCHEMTFLPRLGWSHSGESLSSVGGCDAHRVCVKPTSETSLARPSQYLGGLAIRDSSRPSDSVFQTAG
jgi:hypothetical protein